MKPNFFQYATKELEQDAVICWLLAWSDKAAEEHDPTMHKVGCIFLESLLKLHAHASGQKRSVRVRRQFLRADVVAEVDDDLLLLIEDKVHAGLHGDQLQKYHRQCQAKYPNRFILPTFVKTGDQSDFGAVSRAGYKIVLREDILETLRPYANDACNPILADFVSHMEQRQSRVNSFQCSPVSTWDNDAWKGLYQRLQRALPDLRWDYVANPNSGFFGAWWCFRKWFDANSSGPCSVYLQIEQGPLCFKIEASNLHDKSGQRERWARRLGDVARAQGLEIERPKRMGNGAHMTVSRIARERWLLLDNNGLLDFDATVCELKAAMSVLESAAEDRRLIEGGAASIVSQISSGDANVG